MDVSSTTLSRLSFVFGLLSLGASVWFAAELGRSAGGGESTTSVVPFLLFGFCALGWGITRQIANNKEEC